MCPLAAATARLDPAQRARLSRIRDKMVDRIAEAHSEGQLGEVDGLNVSLAAAPAGSPNSTTSPPVSDTSISACRTGGRDRAEAPSRSPRSAAQHKTIQFRESQIKLSMVAGDIFGVSGRDMLDAMIGGERDPRILAQMATPRMRAKIP